MRKKIKLFLFLPFCFSLFACRTSEPVSSNTAEAVNETLLGLQKRTFTKFTGIFYRESDGEKVFICPRFLLSLSTDQPFVVGNEYRFSLAEEAEFSYYFDQPIRLDEDEVQIECVNDYSNQPGKHLTFCMIEEHYSGPSFGNLSWSAWKPCRKRSTKRPTFTISTRPKTATSSLSALRSSYTEVERPVLSEPFLKKPPKRNRSELLRSETSTRENPSAKKKA